MKSTHPLPGVPGPKTSKFYQELKDHLDVASRLCAEENRSDSSWLAVSCELSVIAEFCAVADGYNYSVSVAEGDEPEPRTRRCWTEGEDWYGVRPHAWARSLAELKRGVVNAVSNGETDPSVLVTVPPPGVSPSVVQKAIDQLKTSGVLAEGSDGRLVVVRAAGRGPR
nr:MAG TPA: hypothetical protein [Caudoviricetes sp.]